MKNLLPYFFSLALIVIAGCKPHPAEPANVKKMPCTFEADSGYVLKKDGLALLIKIRAQDSIDVTGGDARLTDIIGKYYKTATGSYLTCILDIVHYNTNPWPVLIEVSANGTIIGSEDIDGSTYLCCWDDFGFYKKGDYYIIKSCANGSSGYCGAFITPFKNLRSKSSDAITKAVEISEDDADIKITSGMDIKGDTVIMHYKFQKFDNRDKAGTLKSTLLFNIPYVEQNAHWVALDTTNIYKLFY